MKDTRNKRNNLNTKNLPPLFTLIAGFIVMMICLAKKTEVLTMLILIFVSMLVFAIIGTVIKTIVDGFNMKLDYEDLLEEEDEGEIFRK